MKKILNIVYICSIVFFPTACSHSSDDGSKTPATSDTTTVAKDPLPSWNDPLKGDIIDYVTKVSKEGGPDFVPLKDRIATIDNDGTLWAEIPLVQELFAYYRVKKIVTANPSLAKKQPFMAVVTRDKAYFEKGGENHLFN